MGIVYEASLSDGRFYIGATTQRIEKRIRAHYNDRCSYLGYVFHELNYSFDDSLLSVKIIYSGKYFKDYEKCKIYDNRHSNLIINQKFYTPCLKYWIIYTKNIELILNDLIDSGGLAKFDKKSK